MEMNKTEKAFGKLYEIIGRLRAPDGCPWDREQTPKSMRTDLIEETFEAVDAINQQDTMHVKEELGDVIFNTSMIAYMYEQSGGFSLASVLNEVTEKIIRRHPHVFKNSSGASNALEGGVKNSQDVLVQWDAIKRGVEGRGEKSVVDEVAEGLPPLMRAWKMQKKANKVDYKLPSAEESCENMQKALQTAQTCANCESIKDSNTDTEALIGDMLFNLVNIARNFGVDPTIAMAKANTKFRDEFNSKL